MASLPPRLISRRDRRQPRCRSGPTPITRAFLARAICLWTIASFAAIVAAETEPVFDPDSVRGVELPMYDAPRLRYPERRIVVSDAPTKFWKRALERPDAQLQRMTVDTIALAHRRGMPGLDRFIPDLVSLLDQPDQDSELQRATISALIVLDARSETERLAKIARQKGGMVAALVEPALASWKSPAMAEAWRARLVDPNATRIALLHAIRGIAAIEQTEASDSLKKILLDEAMAPNVRLTAADSLGSLHESGLEETLQTLADRADSDLLSAMLVIEAAERHRSSETVATLERLYASESSAVRSRALGLLHRIDPALVDPFAEQAILSRDVNERRWGAKSLNRQRSTAKIAPLSKLLDDANPDLRREVAAALVDLAQDPKLSQTVIDQTMSVLDEDSWRGCEQAAIVLVNLDHKPAGSRLVDLMYHPRDEVMAASAWALGQLELREFLPDMLEQAKEIYNGVSSGRLSPNQLGPEFQIAHLFNAFGTMKYRAADELMREYLPKDHDLGFTARPAAAWGIGLIHEGEAPDDLTDLLIQRINDIASDDPESEAFRELAIISLGRMNSEKAIPHIRKYADASWGTVGMACFWALERMKGEKPPTIPRPVVTYDDWFLGPIRSANRDQPVAPQGVEAEADGVEPGSQREESAAPGQNGAP